MAQSETTTEGLCLMANFKQIQIIILFIAQNNSAETKDSWPLSRPEATGGRGG